MVNVFRSLDESTIWSNEKALDTDYVPDSLPHRESEIQLIARLLLPLSTGRKTPNLFIFGPPGIGKTVVSKKVLNDFEEYSSGRVKGIYINCWDYRTPVSLLSKIVVSLGFPIPRRGISKDEVKEKLLELIEKKRKSIVIVLDEVDKLLIKGQEVLYDLLRINDYVRTPVSLMMISNDPYALKDVDSRIRSSLNVVEIEFKPYTLQEMKDILKERIELAFRPGVVQPGVLLLVSNYAVKHGGDVRIGLELLKKAGVLAEMKGMGKLTVNLVKEVIKSYEPNVKRRLMEEKLTGVNEWIVQKVKERGEVSSGELYKMYSEEIENPISERQFRKHVDELLASGLLNFRWSKGKKGRSRILTYPKK